MSTDPASAQGPGDAPFDVPQMSLPDDGSIRRAVRRGLLLSGLVAAVWLLLAGVVLFGAGVVVASMHTEHFHDVAYYGAQVARPGYTVSGNRCCAGDGGLTNSLDLELHSRGATGETGIVTGRVWRGLTGTLGSALPDENASPIGAALGRERPTKAGTAAFLDSLPPLVSTSAIVEFEAPLDNRALADFPFGDPQSPPAVSPRALLLADPYAGPIVSWQDHDLASFPTWVGKLTSDDNAELDQLGAPSVAELRTVARSPRIHAIVLERATIDELRTLLKNPRVRSVNVAEVGFDPARQSSDH